MVSTNKIFKICSRRYRKKFYSVKFEFEMFDCYACVTEKGNNVYYFDTCDVSRFMKNRIKRLRRLKRVHKTPVPKFEYERQFGITVISNNLNNYTTINGYLLFNNKNEYAKWKLQND